MHRRHEHAQPLAAFALGVAALLWGSAFYFGKIALAELDALDVTVWRFGLAAPVLAGVLAVLRPRMRGSDLPLLVVTGVLCVPIGYLVHFEGLARTTATHAALLVGTGPPLLAAAAAGLGLERLARRDWWAAGVSTVGVAVMVGVPAAGGDLVGDLLVLVSMLIATAWILLSQHLARRLGAAAATSAILLAGTLALLPVLAFTGPPPTDLAPRTWAALAVLSLGCTIVCFILWNWGASRLPAGRAGVFLNLEPVSGALLGVFLLGDLATPSLLLGGAIVLAAAWVVTGSRADAVPAESNEREILA